MEVYIEGGGRKDVHGTEAQFLIEKILRERIYECVYWKEKMFGCNAEIMVDRGADLKAIGGRYGNQRPTDFINCVLKLLQLQPEMEIIAFFIDQKDYKYLTALALFYLRIVGSSLEVHRHLEPLLQDKRKLRKRMADGSYTLTYMDEFVDELLHSDHSCDTILPRLTKRYLLEDQGLIEPRISPLEEELLDDWDDEQVEPLLLEEEASLVAQNTLTHEIDDDFIPPEKVIPLEDIDPLHADKKKKKFSKKKVKGLFKKETSKPKTTIPEDGIEGEDEDRPKPLFKDGSLSFHESNILRANLGLAPLKPPPSHTLARK